MKSKTKEPQNESVKTQKSNRKQEMSDSIRIRTMTVEDFPAVKVLLINNFYCDEPLCQQSYELICNIIQDSKNYDDNFFNFIRQGLSLVGVQNETIVGCVIAHEQVPADIEASRLKAEETKSKIKHIIQFTSKLECEARVYERYGVDKLLYSSMTAVDRNVRGQGLGSRMAAKLIEVGREHGYTLLVANCTSFYTARQKEALGMECAHVVEYGTYKDAEGKIVFTPAAPHTCAKVMVIKL